MTAYEWLIQAAEDVKVLRGAIRNPHICEKGMLECLDKLNGSIEEALNFESARLRYPRPLTDGPADPK